MTHRLPANTVLAATMITLALLGLTACSTRTRAPLPSPRPLSESAELDYDYLVYQDQLQRLQRHEADAKGNKISQKEIAKIKARAEAALNNLLKATPTPQLYLEKAGLFWNDPSGATRSRMALKEGLAQFPDNQILTIYLANSYIVDNEADAAIDVMSQYLKRHPNDIPARERLGQMLMDAGKDAEALDQLKAIPDAKRTADTFYAMGRVQGNLEMRKAAINNLRKAVAMDPDFTEAMVELAYQYDMIKDYVAAEKTYTSILANGDPFPEVRLRLINVNLKLNNPDRALTMALEGPQSKSFILDAALMFINDKFYAQGSTVLDMLTSDGEIPAEYFFNKAVIANEGENDQEKALAYLAKVKENDRLYPHALRFQAQLYHAQGQEEKAFAVVRKAKALYPDGPIFYIIESSFFESQGNWTAAEKVLKEGLKRMADNPNLNYTLAMIYDQVGRRSEGLELLEAILHDHPDHTGALNSVGYMLADENLDLDRALVLVQKAAMLEPDNPYILDSVAWVFFKMNRLDEAWENIRFAVDIMDSDPTIWEHYGDIASAMGKVKSAGRAYNLSLKYNSKYSDRIKKKLNAL